MRLSTRRYLTLPNRNQPKSSPRDEEPGRQAMFGGKQRHGGDLQRSDTKHATVPNNE